MAAKKPKRPVAEGFHQMNVEIRKDVVLKAKVHALYKGLSLSRFVEIALLRALTAVDKPEASQ